MTVILAKLEWHMIKINYYCFGNWIIIGVSPGLGKNRYFNLKTPKEEIYYLEIFMKTFEIHQRYTKLFK